MVCLAFNEGYTTNVAEHGAKAPLCEEAIRLSRLLLRLFPTEPELMGLAALMLLQHAHAGARFDADGAAVLLEDQDRRLWDRRLITDGLALIDKAIRTAVPAPIRCKQRSRRFTPVPHALPIRIGVRSTSSMRRSNACSRRPW
jgi:RNA polymerase sigma-70 factor (ECF subfamily)